MSERVHRAVQAFQVDDCEDEFTISGTGQVIGRGLGAGAFVPDNNIAVTTKHSVPPVHAADSRLFYLSLTVAAISGAALYHIVCRWITTARAKKLKLLITPSKREHILGRSNECLVPFSSSRRRNSAVADLPHCSISRNNFISTSATKKRKVQSPSSLYSPGKNATAAQELDDVPNLVMADENAPTEGLAGPMNAPTGRRAELDIPTESPKHMMLPGKVKTTIEDAREVVIMANMIEQACAEQGRPCDHMTALQWAAKQQKVDKVLNARLEEEKRRLMWDHAQRNVDRTISQQQHEEKLLADKDDKEWLKKLTATKQKSVTALGRSIFHCFVGSLLMNIVSPIVGALQMWRELSYTELMCYGTGTHHDPLGPMQRVAGTYWYDKLFSYPIVDVFVSSTFGEAATCLTVTLVRASYFMLGWAILVIGSWILRLLAFPVCVEHFVKTVYLLIVMSINGLVPELHLTRLVFCLGTVASSAYFMLWYQYKTFRNNFQQIGTPQITVVHECIEWFDDVTSIIDLTPFVGGILWALAIKFGGDK